MVDFKLKTYAQKRHRYIDPVPVLIYIEKWVFSLSNPKKVDFNEK